MRRNICIVNYLTTHDFGHSPMKFTDINEPYMYRYRQEHMSYPLEGGGKARPTTWNGCVQIYPHLVLSV